MWSSLASLSSSSIVPAELGTGRALSDAQERRLEAARDLHQDARSLQQAMWVGLVAEAHTAVHLNVLAAVVEGCGACDVKRTFDLQRGVVSSVVHGDRCKAHEVAGQPR